MSFLGAQCRHSNILNSSTVSKAISHVTIPSESLELGLSACQVLTWIRSFPTEIFPLKSRRSSHQSLWSPVKSGSTPVRGPVKSGRKRTEDKGRGLDERLVWPELVTAWIQRLRTTSVDPLRRFRSRRGDRDRDRDRQDQE